MVENNVELKKENNDFFREWIIEEWKHHNTVDTIYQLRIIKPEELKFQDNEEYYKIMYNNEIGDNIARDLYERLGFKTHYRKMVLKVNDNIYEN